MRLRFASPFLLDLMFHNFIGRKPPSLQRDLTRWSARPRCWRRSLRLIPFMIARTAPNIYGSAQRSCWYFALLWGSPGGGDRFSVPQSATSGSPFWNSGDPVLFCIADQNQYTAIALRDANDPTHQVILKDNLSAVVIDDLSTVVKIAGVLQAHGTKYSLKGEASTTLSDLRNGPTVFVGAFDNAWTLRLTKPLRFHFANNADMTRFWIADSDHPDRIDWVIDRAKQQANHNYRDYAIVTQFTDGNTGKIAIVAAGVGRGGTIAAGEFLIDTAHLTQIVNAARASAGKKNMEFVLSTEIIDGQPGTPKMEAAYFW